jgi:acyl-CoA thioesterase FadM
MIEIRTPEQATRECVTALFRDERGGYTVMQAAKDHAGPLAHQSIDFFKELSYHDRKAIHSTSRRQSEILHVGGAAGKKL